MHYLQGLNLNYITLKLWSIYRFLCEQELDNLFHLFFIQTKITFFVNVATGFTSVKIFPFNFNLYSTNVLFKIHRLKSILARTSQPLFTTLVASLIYHLGFCFLVTRPDKPHFTTINLIIALYTCRHDLFSCRCRFGDVGKNCWCLSITT